MVQESTETTAKSTEDSSAATSASTLRKKKTVVPEYDAVQESDSLVLTVYKFTSRFGKNEGAKEYKVAAESLRAAARLVNIKADSVYQTGVEAYNS